MLVKKLDLSLQAKNNAILSQIRLFGVSDQSILKAIKAVDRTEFTPAGLTAVAYSDAYIEYEPGRAMPALQVIAGILQFLNPKTTSKTLLIGSNYGYLAALLSVMGVRSYIVESSPNLVAKCHEKLKKYSIAGFSSSLLHLGMPDEALFDLIIMEVGGNYIPDAIQEQLAEGGKIVACMCLDVCNFNIYKKTQEQLVFEQSFPADMPLSPEMTKAGKFEF